MRLEKLCADACSCASHLSLGVCHFMACTAAPWLKIRICERERKEAVPEMPGKDSHAS